MCSSLTSAGPLSLQMFLRRSDGLLHYGGDLQLYGWGIAGQQQSVQHVQELHRQQLRQKCLQHALRNVTHQPLSFIVMVCGTC